MALKLSSESLATASYKAFQQTVLDYYRAHGRHDLLWRQPEADGSFDPYKIMVSELMLQQTQVSRVTPKYSSFLKRFPTVQSLAAAELGDVLREWSGLGYNRRAKFLQAAAIKVATEFNGAFPTTILNMLSLSGVGVNTAGAIAAYAFNQPVVYIETNIRTVYIHHFFNDQTDISDSAIKELVEHTLPAKDFRIWYWALMDYGSHLKQTIGNSNRRSKSYTKQAKFAGSRRQLRGQVLRSLAAATAGLTRDQLQLQIDDQRLQTVIDDLLQETLIRQVSDRLQL